MNSTWLVGVDIGGTFTDVVALRADSEEIRSAKVPSRTDDPVAGLMDALRAVELEASDIDNLIHGTTRITNAIVEDKLPPVALLITEGFEDVLSIARLRRRDLYRLDVPPKLPPLVPRSFTVSVEERMDHHGNVLQPLTEQGLADAVAAVKELGVETVAVCLLHAYVNAEHEASLGEVVSTVVPHVSLSHRVNPEAREYERTSSTVLNAAAMPVVVDYLQALLDKAGLEGRLQLFHSAGGWATPEAVRAHPLILAMSGPAAGVAACARVASTLPCKAVLTFDMGGTTTDVCLVVDGEAQVTEERTIAERPVRQPMLAIDSIGAGGGSIVRLGAGGLSIGPDSAGADPGPACYGRGGRAPTVTDANALLGFLGTEKPLGNVIDLDLDKARAAMNQIAEPLGRGVVQTALGVIRVANATMARALRRVTVERGVDGRRCSLLAFGGAGPMHAVGLAEAFGIDEVIVPAVSSAFSAYGCLLADMAYTRQQTVMLEAANFDQDRFERSCTELVSQLTRPFEQHGVDPLSIAVTYTAMMRYQGQSSTVPVEISRPLALDTLADGFAANHETLYGYSTTEPWIMEAVRVRVSAAAAAELNANPKSVPGTPSGELMCWFDANQPTATSSWARESLATGQEVVGPAIIEDAWSTVVLPPGWKAVVDSLSNLLIHRAGLTS